MAYRAEIEIAVRGARQLQELRNRIESTANSIDEINRGLVSVSQGTVASFSELSRSLRDAQQNFNDAARGTSAYGNALDDLLAAERSYNTELRERSRLLNEVAENERRVKLASAGIRERTQYSGPIGPGEASPINALVGQSSEVAGRVQRIKDIKDDQRALDEALLNLEKKSAAELNKKVQLQESLVEGTREVLELVAEAQRIQQRTAPAERLAQSSIKEAAEREARFEARKTFAGQIFDIEKNFSKQLNDADLEFLRKKFIVEEGIQKQLFDRAIALDKEEGKAFDAELKRRTEAKAAAIKKENRIAEQVARRRKEALGSGIIGGAFPLLFGQGIGAAVGGGAGGAAGGLIGGQFGFGLSLVGTALGTAADTFAKNMASLASSLSKPTEALQALEDAGLKVDEATSKQVESLMEAGRAYEAQQLVLEEINDKLGPNAVAQLAAYDQEMKELEQRYQEVTAALTKELLPAMLGFITLINNLAGAFGNMPDWMVNFIKGATSSGPFGVARFQLETLQNIGKDRAAAEGNQIPTPELDPKLTERSDRLKKAEDERKAALRAENDTLQAQLNLLNSGLDLTTDRGLELAKEAVVVEYLGELEKIRNSGLKDGEKTLRERQALLKQNLAIARLEQQQRVALERAAQQAAQQAAREEKARRSQLESADIALLNAQKERFAFDVKLAEFEGGKEAALRKRLEQLTEERNAEIVILNIQANQRINNAKSLQEAQALIETAAAKRDLLIQQYKLEQDMTVKAQERLALERELAKLAGERETEDIGIGLRRQIDAVERRISSPFGGQDSEMLELRIKQLEKQEDIYGDLDRQIDDVNKKLEKDKSNKDLQQQLGLLTERRLKYEELLPVLNQVEQKELQMQQTLQQLQPLTNALSQGLTDLFTGLIDGSKDAQEVFAAMLKNMGQALIQQGAVMIAQYIAIGIARIFAGMGGKKLDVAGIQQYSGIGANTPVTPFAEGGFVTGPTRALVGEGGQPEYIIPEDKMRESMERYSRGARGSSVIPQNGDTVSTGTGNTAVASKPIDVRYTVERINNVEYVTADQFQAGMRQAAQQGAMQGERRALTTLKQNTTQRRRIGL